MADPVIISADGAVPFPSDPARTAIVQMHLEPGMIADRVLPPSPPLMTAKFEWFQFRAADAFEVPDTRLGRKSMPTEVEISGEIVQDRTEHYGLLDKVPQEDIDAARGGLGAERTWPNPGDTASLFMTHLLKLSREVRTADLVFGNDSYGADYRSVVGATDRFDADASDPIDVIEGALEVPLFRPNVLVFGQPAWRKFRRHPKIVAATNMMSGAESGLASRRAIAELFEVDEVLVGRSRVAMNVEGQPLQLKRAWGKSVAAIYRGAYAGSAMPGGEAGSEGVEAPPMIGDARMPTFGFTAVYKALETLSRMNQGTGIRGVEEIIVRESCKEVIAGGSAFGYLLSGVVS